jgi:methionyl-tRNA synthetase
MNPVRRAVRQPALTSLRTLPTVRRMLTIDEFQRLELRVATILSAEPHPNADRLLVLKIDLGNEQRQLVAGIRAHYAPETLVGKQIVVVANIEPATLRGVESQGMILAASDTDGRLAIVIPETPVANGATVK